MVAGSILYLMALIVRLAPAVVIFPTGFFCCEPSLKGCVGSCSLDKGGEERGWGTARIKTRRHERVALDPALRCRLAIQHMVRAYCAQVLAKRLGHRVECNRMSGLGGHPGTSVKDGILFCKSLWGFL